MSQDRDESGSEGFIKQAEIDGKMYTFLPIDVSIKYYDKIKSGFFVPLSDTKRVRIELNEGDIQKKLKDYRKKGLSNILFEDEDYHLFLLAVKRGLTSFFMKDDSNIVLNNDQIKFLVRKCILYNGIEESYADLGDDYFDRFYAWVKTSLKVYPYYKRFLKENQDQFIINLFSSYVAIALAEALNWPRHVGEKIIQASLLADLTLEEKDYLRFIASNGNRSKWTTAYKKHPVEMAQILRKNHGKSIGREVLRAVEQHQELPDGSGYPQALKGLSIDQLSAIIIVARTFTDALVESNFSYDDREKFISDLLEDKFDYPNFKNPTKALYMVLGIKNDV